MYWLALRYRLGFDAPLVTDVLRILVGVVFGSARRRAGFAASDRTIRCGSVTFVQRFGGKLNVNVHFHMLALDGVYAEDKRGHIRFHPGPPPSDGEVARVVDSIHRRVVKLLERRDIQADASEGDTLGHDQPVLAELYSASVSGRVAAGNRTGHRLAKVGDKVHRSTPNTLSGPRCAAISGFSLHANVAVSARDRTGLERLARYAGRPPLAIERLSRLTDGSLLYRLKRRWPDGTSHIIFEPLDFVAKLAALVPPPRFNSVRYHGCWPLPPAGDRSWFRPILNPPTRSRTSNAAKPVSDPKPQQTSKPRARNYSWAQLMRRVSWRRDLTG